MVFEELLLIVTYKKDHPGFKQGGLISWEEGFATSSTQIKHYCFFGQSLKFGDAELLSTNRSFIH
jgi:hypothetical protein